MKPFKAEPYVGIPAMGYYLPPTRQTILEVVAAGQAISDADKLTQLGFDAIRAAPSVDNVLCVATDQIPADARREIVYNLISDGECAAVVSCGAHRDCTVNHDPLFLLKLRGGGL